MCIGVPIPEGQPTPQALTTNYEELKTRVDGGRFTQEEARVGSKRSAPDDECGGTQGGATPLETEKPYVRETGRALLFPGQAASMHTAVARAAPPVPKWEMSCVEAVMAHLERGCPISEAEVASILGR